MRHLGMSVISVFLLATAAFADQSTPAKVSLTLTSTTPDRVTSDLEIRIGSTSPFDFASGSNNINTGPFGGGTAVHPTSGTPPVEDRTQGMLRFVAGKNLAAGTGVTVGVTVNATKNEITVIEGAWSFPDGTTEDLIVQGSRLLPPLPTFTFTAKPVGDPQTIFSITNGSNAFLTYTDIRFLNNSPELSLGDPIGTLPGFTPFLSSLVLNPGATSSEFLFPDITPGNFLYVEGALYVTDSTGTPLPGARQISLRFGHQSPIPEPTTITIFGTGAAGLLGYRLLRYKWAI